MLQPTADRLGSLGTLFWESQQGEIALQRHSHDTGMNDVDVCVQQVQKHGFEICCWMVHPQFLNPDPEARMLQPYTLNPYPEAQMLQPTAGQVVRGHCCSRPNQ